VSYVVIILGLGSAHEQKHVFGFLSLAYLSMVVTSSTHFPANDIILLFFASLFNSCKGELSIFIQGDMILYQE
jgi:hypothetical protein